MLTAIRLRRTSSIGTGCDRRRQILTIRNTLLELGVERSRCRELWIDESHDATARSSSLLSILIIGKLMKDALCSLRRIECSPAINNEPEFVPKLISSAKAR